MRIWTVWDLNLKGGPRCEAVPQQNCSETAGVILVFSFGLKKKKILSNTRTVLVDRKHLQHCQMYRYSQLPLVCSHSSWSYLYCSLQHFAATLRNYYCYPCSRVGQGIAFATPTADVRAINYACEFVVVMKLKSNTRTVDRKHLQHCKISDLRVLVATGTRSYRWYVRTITADVRAITVCMRGWQVLPAVLPGSTTDR